MLRLKRFIKEIEFILNIIFTGKLFVIYNRSKYKPNIGKQSIRTFNLSNLNIKNVDDLLSWLSENKIQFINRRWTIYIPPQVNSKKCFNSIYSHFPSNSGMKILKDFNRPEKAKYTHPRLMNPNGLFLPKLIAHSPISLVRVANYLYVNNIGSRLYDLVTIKFKTVHISCFVVEHIHGKVIQEDNYHSFMKKMKKVLLKHEIITVTGTNKKAYTGKKTDFKPNTCNNNLVVDKTDGKEYFVDFQGFILKNENKLIKQIISEFNDQSKQSDIYSIYENIPGFAIGKSNQVKNEDLFETMLKEYDHSFEKSVVFDVTCNTGLRLYNALIKGAIWAYGWDHSQKIKNAKKLLLALGATRFDLFEENIGFEERSLKRHLDLIKGNDFSGIVFLTEPLRDSGILPYVLNIPWTYLFYGADEKESKQTQIKIKLGLKKLDLISEKSIHDNQAKIFLYKRER